jgi:7,8-dihydroneopterin aldolase/epimerase/oxygenase
MRIGLRHQPHNCEMDRILLEGMSFQGRHGVRPAEREQPQEFKVDVEVDCDLSEPGKSDSIEDTVDYRQVRAIAKEVIEGESQKLLETLAARIADQVLQLQKVAGVSVRISKRPESMQPIGAAAVRINRTRA